MNIREPRSFLLYFLRNRYSDLDEIIKQWNTFFWICLLDFETDDIEAILKGARMLHRMDDYDVEFTDSLEINYGVVDIYYDIWIVVILFASQWILFMMEYVDNWWMLYYVYMGELVLFYDWWYR